MVSIIMPAYNAERHIEEAIQSVLGQSCPDWELIVIDDCSEDGTARLVEELAKGRDNIRCIRNERNAGAAESRNRGVAAASGEWVAFLDSDDVWHPDKLMLQLQLAAEKGADFVFSGSAFLDEGGRPLRYYLPAPETLSYRELLKQNLISCSSVLLKRELALRYPMRGDRVMHEDFAAWLHILRDGNRVAFGINLPLLRYRVSAGSKSGNKLRAARMTYRVYRCLGIPPLPAFYYWLCYALRSLKKYRHLKFFNKASSF